MEWLNYTNVKKMDYFKSRLNKGVCKSLKKEKPDDYNDFLYLFQTHHPEKETKLKEGMMMMGLRGDVHYWSWIFHFMCLFLPLSIKFIK